MKIHHISYLNACCRSYCEQFIHACFFSLLFLYLKRAGRYGQKKKKKITIAFFISIDTDKFQIFISFKFKGRFLLPSESCRNQTINCGFKLEHDKHFVFELFTIFQSFFLNKLNVLIEQLISALILFQIMKQVCVA